MFVHIEVKKKRAYISILYYLTHRTMNDQFNYRIYNISMIQNISYVVASIKVISIF